MGRIDFDDLQGERSYSDAHAYNRSKLANQGAATSIHLASAPELEQVAS
jgi:hypothetical protein